MGRVRQVHLSMSSAYLPSVLQKGRTPLWTSHGDSYKLGEVYIFSRFSLISKQLYAPCGKRKEYGKAQGEK